MDPLLLIIVAIAALTGVRWFRGVRENRMLILHATEAMERAFQPEDTKYTNIGGSIGYNFAYTLSHPYIRLEGTITTLPRHAVFYLPISLWLFHREDLLLFTLYGEPLEAGLGHIAERERYRHGRLPVEDQEDLQSMVTTRGSRQYVILYYNPQIRERLSGFLEALSEAALESILYIGYYGNDSHIAVTMNPTKSGLEGAITELTGAIADKWLRD
ncbi:MAG: hypothetical protein ACOCU4_09870 [Alkalispirochaeta sp.]